jgi:putative thiamine transport system substrate-binding protein
MKISRRAFIKNTGGIAFTPQFIRNSFASNWTAVEAEAKGQTVYFNAWAGSETINAYIKWAGDEIEAQYGVKIEHVKITDTAEVVMRVRDEVAAGKQEGSVDLVWINGENFRVMKNSRLLFGPFAELLPNFQFVDVDNKPTTRIDFQEPVEGLESPWGMAQFTFFADGAKVPKPPKSMAELATFAEANPGRVTYSAPPDFFGTTFLKQVFVETAADQSAFGRPVEKDTFVKAAEPLFAFLDDVHKYFWREGKQFPKDQAQITQMVADGELLMGLTFNPNEPANLVAAGTMPTTTIAWQHTRGTIGNTHFVAIPVNAKAKAGAQVVANFLLSPEAQAKKNDLKIWGDPTVLSMKKLGEKTSLFTASAVPGMVVEPAPVIPEPHASWVGFIEASWLERYGNG